MATKIVSVMLTLAAYTDSHIGFTLRGFMVRPLGAFDPELANYILWFAHF